MTLQVEGSKSKGDHADEQENQRAPKAGVLALNAKGQANHGHDAAVDSEGALPRGTVGGKAVDAKAEANQGNEQEAEGPGVCVRKHEQDCSHKVAKAQDAHRVTGTHRVGRTCVQPCTERIVLGQADVQQHRGFHGEDKAADELHVHTIAHQGRQNHRSGHCVQDGEEGKAEIGRAPQELACGHRCTEKVTQSRSEGRRAKQQQNAADFERLCDAFPPFGRGVVKFALRGQVGWVKGGRVTEHQGLFPKGKHGAQQTDRQTSHLNADAETAHRRGEENDQPHQHGSVKPQHGIWAAKPPLSQDQDANHGSTSPRNVRDQDHDAEEHPGRGHTATDLGLARSAGHDRGAYRFEHRSDDQHGHNAVESKQFVERKPRLCNERFRPCEEERFVGREGIEEPNQGRNGKNPVPAMAMRQPTDHDEEKRHPESNVEI